MGLIKFPLTGLQCFFYAHKFCFLIIADEKNS